jgi:hypothetical protein
VNTTVRAIENMLDELIRELDKQFNSDMHPELFIYEDDGGAQEVKDKLVEIVKKHIKGV